jgi:CTP synthase
MKYVVVIGSVMSGIGKGITASSIGVVLKSRGLRVTAIKIDPYLNLDSGTMSPFEHGECYVLDDGGETDLDLGNYERFLDLNLTSDHNITTGKIYSQIIQDERAGKYLGKTVQVIPHVTNAIQNWIERVAQSGEDNDICMIELGGTIGDLESDAYVEALRQLGFRLGRENVCYVNVCYCPVVGDEVKTKPAQNGIAEMRRRGLNPDLLIVRCERDLDDGAIEKLSNFCQISKDKIIINQNVKNIYQVPLNFHSKNVYSIIAQQLMLNGRRLGDANPNPNTNTLDLQYIHFWIDIADNIDNPDFKEINVGIIGKYTGLADSYLSLSHAIRDAGLEIGCRTNLIFVDASSLEDLSHHELSAVLSQYTHLIIPGGFGQRGIEGMIRAAEYARVHHVPCLGICLGFQIMIIEYSRHALGLTDANSTEVDPETPHPVITIMEKDQVIMGGSMRLGLHSTRLAKGSQVWTAYNSRPRGKVNNTSTEVEERHRHRYEVNPQYIDRFDSTDLWFSGVSLDGERMEVCEITDRKSFYMGVQFHPEFLTRPGFPHPVFVAWLQGEKSF